LLACLLLFVITEAVLVYSFIEKVNIEATTVDYILAAFLSRNALS